MLNVPSESEQADLIASMMAEVKRLRDNLKRENGVREYTVAALKGSRDFDKLSALSQSGDLAQQLNTALRRAIANVGTQPAAVPALNKKGQWYNAATGKFMSAAAAIASGASPVPTPTPTPTPAPALTPTPLSPNAFISAERQRYKDDVAERKRAESLKAGSQDQPWVKNLVTGIAGANRHVLLEGRSGSGKSMMTQHIAFERMKLGEEVTVVDTHTPQMWKGAKQVFGDEKSAGKQAADFMTQSLAARKQANLDSIATAGKALTTADYKPMTIVLSDFARLMKDSKALQDAFRTGLTEFRKFNIAIVADTTSLTAAASGVGGIKDAVNNFAQKVKLLAPTADDPARKAIVEGKEYKTPLLQAHADKTDFSIIKAPPPAVDEKLKGSIDQLIAKQKQMAATYNMTAREVTLYELKLRGATEVQLAEVSAAMKEVEQLEAREKVQRRLVNGLQRTEQVADIASNAANRYMSGGMQSANEQWGVVHSLASQLPGFVGQIAGSVTGIIGSLISIFTFRYEQMIQRAMAGANSVVSGSRNMQQALSDVKASTLTEEFRALSEQMMRQRAQVQSGFFPGLTTEAFAGGNETQINDAVQRMQNAQSALRQLFANPQFQAMQRAVANEHALQNARDVTLQTTTSAGSAQAESQQLLFGRRPEEAAQAVQRYNMVQELANRIQLEGESRTNALTRAHAMLYEELENLSRAQREQLTAQSTLGLERQNFASRERVELMGRQLSLIQAQGSSQIPIVDMEQQRLEVLRLRTHGLISQETALRRMAEINSEAGAVERRQATERARGMRESNIRPLERALRDYRDLQTTVEQGGFGVGNVRDQETVNRAEVALAQALIDAAGPMNRLAPALEEGSVAAARAVAAAEREQLSADPATALPAAISALRQRAEQQSEYQAQMLQELRRLREQGEGAF